MYSLIEFLLSEFWYLAHNITNINNLLVKFLSEGFKSMDKDRLERIRKRRHDVPEDERSDLFDCYEDGYILLSNGYRHFKPYPKESNEDE